VPEILADVSGKCICALGKLPGRTYVSICQMILAFRIIQSLSKRTNKLFPLGYTLVAGK